MWVLGENGDTVKKLLVVDNEEAVLEKLEALLAKEGYEVITARSGQDGLTALKQHKPELVLTDIQMPGMDGLEILRGTMAMDYGAEVIVMTEYGDTDGEIAALSHGASDIVCKPVRDELLLLAVKRAGERISFSRHLRDCTGNLEQAREALMKDKRLATIGEAVAGLAHYLKNVLTGLRGGMYMVSTGMAKDKPGMQEEGWAMVQRNVEDLGDLVVDVLRYSKDRTPERSKCRPNEIVSEVAELMKKRAEQHQVKLNVVLDPNLREAYIDRNGIRDVLLNLVSNGIDACIYDTDTSKAWQVTITSELVTDAKSGQSILFQVTDNGTGITDDVKSRLFTGFFSTKGGRGTGLGLLGSQKIIQEHGGEISVESTVGQGTTFSVRLEHKIPPDN